MDATISPPIQRLAAFGLTIAAIIFLSANLIAPSWERLFEMVVSIREARFDQARLGALAEQTTTLDLAAVDARRQAMVRHLIDAPTREVAQAALQARLQQLLSSPELIIETRQPGPAQQTGPVMTLSATVRGRASERAWLLTLAAIEQAGPTIIVERARMTSAKDMNQARRIAFELTLTGFWTAKAGHI